MQAMDELGIVYGSGGVTLISFDAVRRALSYCKDGKIDPCAECNLFHGRACARSSEQLERGETPEKQSYVPEQLFYRRPHLEMNCWKAVYIKTACIRSPDARVFIRSAALPGV